MMFSKPLERVGSGLTLFRGGASTWSTPCSMGPAACVQTLRGSISARDPSKVPDRPDFSGSRPACR
jgi:hypothetical protein